MDRTDNYLLGRPVVMTIASRVQDKTILEAGVEAIRSSKALLLRTPATMQKHIESRSFDWKSGPTNGEQPSSHDHAINTQVQALDADLDELERIVSLLDALSVVQPPSPSRC